MWRKQAVCVGCGAYKRRPQQRCRRCGFEPGSDYEIGRAMILSRQMQVGDVVIGRSPAELKRIAADIRSGRPYLFDPNEEHTTLHACRQLRVAAARTRKRKIAGVIAIAILILGIAYLSLTNI